MFFLRQHIDLSPQVLLSLLNLLLTLRRVFREQLQLPNLFFHRHSLPEACQHAKDLRLKFTDCHVSSPLFIQTVQALSQLL